MRSKPFPLFCVCALFVILGSMAAYWSWEHRSESTVSPKPPAVSFVDLGELSALAGGDRLVKATIVLELEQADSTPAVNERMASVKETVLRRFNGFTGATLSTADGKLEFQSHIRASLNELCGPGTVRTVFFTSFYMSLS